MAKTEVLCIHIDSQLKTQAASVLAELGITSSQAIQMLFYQVARARTLPFDVTVARLNERARQAMAEHDQPHNLRMHENAEALFKNLGI
ncbi:type II toxin-antitoxin system RelB/DinJ family antitoxin [Pseudomonas xanthosomatis]|uniref:type II toxin-antitoxin system RelB/DinJ family antitoxin n=1 Tax=Pseudomonas xanthosomatis TaxID=2842356 RepID=UPI003515BA54